jgi:hypothetical protein
MKSRIPKFVKFADVLRQVQMLIIILKVSDIKKEYIYRDYMTFLLQTKMCAKLKKS